MISYVNISHTQVQDSGLYRCTADNGLAQVSHEALISVAGPVQVKPMLNVTVLAASNFKIRCPVAGHPVGDIQWEHDGRRLPANHRQHVYENGTLELEHLERTDEGQYTCLAQSGQLRASGSTHLRIKVKPVIEPFAISRSLREGQRASIMCTVSSGDLPLAISWFRDQQPISGQDSWPPQVVSSAEELAETDKVSVARVSRVSDYSSTLLFESLSAHHSANYTCLAKNEAGSASHQAQMLVQGE